MFRAKLILSIVICFLFIVGNLSADMKFEAGINNGYMGNLLDDNNDVDDTYTTASGRIYLYPLRSIEISGAAEYTYYSETFNISNFMMGGGITFIPAKRTSMVMPYLKGSFFASKYRERFSGFNNNSGDVSGGLVFKVNSQFHCRIGGKYGLTSYLDNDIYDQQRYELFLGLNKTVLTNNTFDIEFGIGSSRYNSIRDDISDVLPPVGQLAPSDTIFIKRDLESIYFSPRFSRPIGKKTGINITYLYRSFTNDEDGIVFGSSSENLSPWSSLWEGSSITSTIKTLFFTDAIVTAGVGYFEKRFIRTLEQGQFFLTQLGPARHDYQTKLYFKIQRPIATKQGWFIEPSLSAEFSFNESTVEIDVRPPPPASRYIDHRYDYWDFTIFWGIILRK